MSSVTGSKAAPAASGEKPATTCRVSTRKKKTPPSAPYTAKVTTLVALNSREEKMPSGSIGARAECSRQTNAASPSTPTTRVSCTSAEVGPSSCQAISA